MSKTTAARGGGGGGIGMPGGAGGLGIGTVIILGLVGWALGIDPRLLIGGAEIVMGGRPGQQDSPAAPTRTAPPTDELGRFVAGVLGETEDRWKEIFRQVGRQYREPKLVLFSGAVRAGSCGMAQSAMGPFYCPPDQRIYLDTSFFRDLADPLPRLPDRQQILRVRACLCDRARGRASCAEPARHPAARCRTRSARSTGAQANQLQVRVELQADCFAGVWAHHSEQRRRFLEPGDIEAALATAAAIGDDRLQRRRKATWCPTASPTARPSSGSAGSRSASTGQDRSLQYVQ